LLGRQDYIPDGHADILGRDGGGQLVLWELNGVNGAAIPITQARPVSGAAVSSAVDVTGTSGADTLTGGTGNDRYTIDHAGDAIVEQPNQGADTAYSSLADYTLAPNVENLVLLPVATNGSGNTLDNVLVGNPSANVLAGDDGADTLYGDGGADTLNGGNGNDVIKVPDLAFAQVDGSAGTDTLAFTGKNLVIDLTQLDNTKTHGIEKVDITGSGNNTLSLALSDVLDLSDTSNQLTIDGNAGDALVLMGPATGPDAWSAGGVSGGYHTYTAAGATLLVDTDITVTNLFI
jgi:Ca2+-binding RTX toxin-like protein